MKQKADDDCMSELIVQLPDCFCLKLNLCPIIDCERYKLQIVDCLQVGMVGRTKLALLVI